MGPDAACGGQHGRYLAIFVKRIAGSVAASSGQRRPLWRALGSVPRPSF